MGVFTVAAWYFWGALYLWGSVPLFRVASSWLLDYIYCSGKTVTGFMEILLGKMSRMMNKNQKLRWIKLLHTVVWAMMVVAIFHILYSGWSGNISTLTYAALGLVGLEVIILLINNWVCPMTPMARQYSDSGKANFDIYLPEWLAKYNKEIFGTLFVVGVGLVVWRLIVAG